MEIFKLTVSILGPFIAAFLTYYFAIKGKQKDTDIQTKYELNLVLSNLLTVRQYLLKLEDHFLIKFEKDFYIPIPKHYLSLVLFNSGILNDNCFKELEVSVANLKKYDPLTFYKLEGVGNRLEFLKKTFIIPFLKSKATTEFSKTLSAKQLLDTIAEIDSYIIIVAERVGKELKSSVQLILKRDIHLVRENAKDEMLKEYFNFLSSIFPELNLNFEEYIESIKNPQLQKAMDEAFEKISPIEFDKLMELILENPSASLQTITAQFAIRRAST